MKPAICAGVSSPRMIWRMMLQHLVVEHLAVLDGALDRLLDRDLLHAFSSSSVPIDEIPQHAVAVLGEQRLGVETAPLPPAGCGAQPHDLAVLPTGRDIEAIRQRRPLHDQRVGSASRRNDSVFP